MRLALAVLLSLLLAPSALAAWSDPVGGSEVPAGQASGVLAADGTPIVAWSDADGVHARIGTGAPVLLAPYAPDQQQVHALAGGQDVAVVWFGDQATHAATGTVAAGLGTPVTVAEGYLERAVANAAGDMALLFAGSATTQESFRPAGGTFGTPLQTPAPVSPPYSRLLISDLSPSLALGPTGETLVGWMTRDSAQVAARVRDGAFGPGASVGGPGGLSEPAPALALDAHGRALAAWEGETDGAVVAFSGAASVRDAQGAWHAVSGLPPALARAQAATDDAGNGLLASGGSVLAISLATGAVGREVDYPMDFVCLGCQMPFDVHGTWAPPTLSVGENGAAALTWGHDRDVLVARGDTSGAFGAPEVARCQLLFSGSTQSLGLDTAGHAGVLFNAYPDGQLSVARDGVDGPVRSCPAAEPGGGYSRPTPALTYGATPVVAGHPVSIATGDLRQPNARLIRNEWDVDENGWRPPVGNAVNHVTLTFPTPGPQQWALTTIQHYEGLGDEGIRFEYEVDVYAPATLTARAKGRTLHLRATAFTYGPRVPVTLVARRAGQTRAGLTTALGLDPLTASLRVHHAGRYRVRLLQGKTIRARATVRVK
jgi:hypothetical protein